jgi:hypothetical protein
MPHDSAAGEGAQIINPLGFGTVASYCASGVWTKVSAEFRRALISRDPKSLRRASFGKTM